MGKGKLKKFINKVDNALDKATQKTVKAVTTAAKTTGKAVATAAKTTGKAVATATKKTVVAAKKAIDTGKLKAAMALLVPLRPLGKIVLERRGIKPSNDNTEFAAQLHAEMSKKSFAYEGGDSFDYGVPSHGELASYGFVVTPEMILAVVAFLKGIWDKIKKKKEKGEPLSPDEKAIDDRTEEISKAMEEANQIAEDTLTESEKKAADMINKDDPNPINWKIALAAFVVIVLVILVVFFMRRR